MRKLLSVTLALGMGFTALTGLTAFAEERSIDVEGYIGLEDEDGNLPPGIISVEVPAEGAKWFVNAGTEGKVESATYAIENQSPNANLTVTFNEYYQNNDVKFDGDLMLNLTGDLALPDILTTKNHTYDGVLLSQAAMENKGSDENDQWSFGFNGTYTGTLKQVLKPTYELVLQFEVESYTSK